MADQEESSRPAPPMTPPPPPPPSPAIPEDNSCDAILWAASNECSSITPHTDLLSLWLSNYTALPPMTPPPPPPPSPAIHEDSSTDAILWAASDDCSSSTPHTDLFSLWVSDNTALPQHEAEEEPLADVPTLLNFDLESSFPDLVDWNTTSAAVTPAVPVVTEPLWVQLHTPAAGEMDDLTGLTLGIQSPKPSNLPPALENQFPEASISPPAPGIQSPPSSFKIQSPQASLPPLAPEIHSSISPLARGIQSPQASISPPISPLALETQSPQVSVGIQSAPASCSSLPAIPCTLPMAPPLWNFPPSPSPVPERRSWSVFPSTHPPAWRHLLLPHSASSSMSSSPSHPSHQTHHFSGLFFPTPNRGYQQQVPVAHANPVTSSTPNANTNSFAGFDPANRPSWSQAMAQRGSWFPNQPWIGNGQDMKLPIPRPPRFLLPPAVATMPEPPPVLAYFGSSVGNMPNSNATGDVPVEDHQRVQTRKSRKPSRKKNKLAVRADNKK